MKFKTKLTEEVSTYKVILCSGKSPVGCGSALHLSAWETWASSQKKNALIINKIKANSIYLVSSYKWREIRGTSGKCLYYTSWPYPLLFFVIVGKEQCSYTTKINYVFGTPGLFWTHTAYLHGKIWSSGEMRTQRGWISTLIIQQTELDQENLLKVVQEDQEYDQTFCTAASLLISLRCNIQLHQQSRNEKEAADCLSPLFKHTGKSHNSSSCGGGKKECHFTSSVRLVTTKSLVSTWLNSKGYFKVKHYIYNLSWIYIM